MNESSPPVTVSIVVPVYAGAAFLIELVDRLERSRTELIDVTAPVHIAELIFVDDAAIDHSPVLLDQLAADRPWLRVLHLSKNFGQHPATIAGILYSCGDWVVTLDEDLQHPPEKLQDMLALAATKGLDVIYAEPEGAIHQSLVRDAGSRLFKRLIATLTGERHIPLFNSFRLLRGPVARAASSVCAHETYFDVALCWFTQRIGTLRIDMKDQRVISGANSGYSLRKLFSHARRMAMSTQVKLLRIGALLGLLTTLVGVGYAAFLIMIELTAPGSSGARGWPSLMVTHLLFNGIVLFLVSVMLEYLSILTLRAQGKPTFFAVDRSSDARVAAYFASQPR